MRRWLIRRALLGEAGFSLIEAVIAIAILTIAILGVTVAVGIQSGGLASSVTSGQAAVTRGHYLSTATMLAQQRLEQVKRLRYEVGTGALDQLGGSAAGSAPTGAGFGDETPVAGFPNFDRRVRVVTTAGSTLKTVTVTVTLTLPVEYGRQIETVSVSTVVAARPTE